MIVGGITENYSKFYKGTEPLKSYGSADGISGKNTLVKYEFSTTDEQGNKVMDKMSREETLDIMNKISAQYGDNVIVEFSGDAMASLVKTTVSGKTGIMDKMAAEQDPAKQAAFDADVVQLENTHRIIIPNIQTNKMLYDSLEGAEENVVQTATGIIKNYLLPWNVGGMSEQERKDQIAFGLESARYLAENYLEGDKADKFLTAMETIAKYGLSGKVSEDGKVQYDIKKGPMAGAPDDFVDTMDILKQKAPDLYREVKELNQDIINQKGNGKFSTRFLELFKKVQKVLDSKSSSGMTNREEAVQDYAAWKSNIEKTKLPESFQNVSYKDGQSFLESLKNQTSLSNEWITKNVNRLLGWIDGQNGQSAANAADSLITKGIYREFSARGLADAEKMEVFEDTYQLTLELHKGIGSRETIDGSFVEILAQNYKKQSEQIAATYSGDEYDWNMKLLNKAFEETSENLSHWYSEQMRILSGDIVINQSEEDYLKNQNAALRGEIISKSQAEKITADVKKLCVMAKEALLSKGSISDKDMILPEKNAFTDTDLKKIGLFLLNGKKDSNMDLSGLSDIAEGIVSRYILFQQEDSHRLGGR